MLKLTLWSAHLLRATTLIFLGRYEESLRSAEAAMAIDPSNKVIAKIVEDARAYERAHSLLEKPPDVALGW